MPRPHQSRLTPFQIEIMNLFWERGELGVAQVWKALAETRPIARNTVQTMLARLSERGWLRAAPTPTPSIIVQPDPKNWPNPGCSPISSTAPSAARPADSS